MHLKKLEMQGFKSFPDKTVIAFDKGLTVIVGPNGSGKSNISDAMRWVLGEISSKSIRGTKMEDVIFAGSSQRSPMNFAEVSVTFDNTDPEGKIVVGGEYDEITVTRRFYRVGESEYFINKKPVRLKDIHELFFNTGLGKGGYSIIGQGKIAEIISRKNDERRAVFEEAAGISKYKFQKQEATRNLDQTEANLLRLSDITEELSSRIGPLKKESERAKKYLEVYEQKKTVDISLSLYDIERARSREAELSGEVLLSRSQLENATDELSEQERRETSLSEQQSVSRLEMERLTSEIASRTEEKHKNESDILVFEKENGMLDEQRIAAESRREDERKSAEEAERELSEKETALNAAMEKKAEKEEALAALEREIAEYEEDLSQTEENDSDTARRKAALGQSSVDIRIRVSALEAEREANRKKLGSLCETLEKHDSDLALYDERIEAANRKLEGLREKETSLNAEIEALREKEKELEDSRAKEEKKKNDTFLEISARKHKMQNLIRMDELLEGFSRAVRFVMTEFAAGHMRDAAGKPLSLYGPLSKLVTVDEKYAVALETAFGQNLQNIVVQDEKSAKGAIEYLKRKNAGRATFYPVETMKGTELDPKSLPRKAEGFIAVASTLVSCDPKFKGIVRSLVGRILIADTMDHAASLAKALDYRFRVVTLDGQVINAGGSFTGGSSSVDSPFLSRRAQIDTLQNEIAELEKAGAEVDKNIAALESGRDELSKKVSLLLGSAAMARRMTEAESTQTQVLLSGRGLLEEARNEAEKEKDTLTRTLAASEETIASLTRQSDEFGTESRLLDLKETELKYRRASLDEKIASLSEKRSELRIELARETAGTELLLSVLEALRSKAAIFRDSLASLNETIRYAEEKTAENRRKAEERKNETLVLTKALSELEEKRSALSAESLAAERTLTELRARAKDLSGKRDILFRQTTKVESELERVKENADSLLSFLWEDYELSYSEAQKLCTAVVTPATRPAAVAEQTKLKNVIRSLGNVNVGAIEEYKEVSERYATYSEQMDDLQKSRESLLSTITDLDERMSADFASTVERINVHFQKVFAELFGGGHAEIRLSEPDNILESGIDINVAPPGKVIKSLSLLSGGEQAFVAIALYFAILKVNPSPFCIMDEIEAALDEVNVDKFAEYVKHYADKTQFVLITHRRGTMEAAERLYGVTMHEKGISDIMSVDVSEIESRLGKSLAE